jgi:hypothetical protein
LRAAAGGEAISRLFCAAPNIEDYFWRLLRRFAPRNDSSVRIKPSNSCPGLFRAQQRLRWQHKMLTKFIARTGICISVAVMAAAFIALSSGSASAQAIRCEALVFAEERIACYNYRASIAPGPSCLFCPPVQKPPPRKKPRHKRG